MHSAQSKAVSHLVWVRVASDADEGVAGRLQSRALQRIRHFDKKSRVERHAEAAPIVRDGKACACGCELASLIALPRVALKRSRRDRSVQCCIPIALLWRYELNAGDGKHSACTLLHSAGQIFSQDRQVSTETEAPDTAGVGPHLHVHVWNV